VLLKDVSTKLEKSTCPGISPGGGERVGDLLLGTDHRRE